MFTYYYDFGMLSAVQPSSVVNRVRLSQVDDTRRCTLFTALSECILLYYYDVLLA